MNGSDLFFFSPEVAFALSQNNPIVALESTVIAHGLPYPNNVETALALEEIVRENGAVPATIAVLDGVPNIGLSREKINFLAQSKTVHKLSRRDLPAAIGRKWNGATTVATTAFLAHKAGIRVFATGGIGGVHRGATADVSADLPELAKTPITVVCAGAKAILDLPATREWLETNGICIVGWQTDEMPAFYSRRSGLKTDTRVENAREAAQIINARDALGLENAVLITAPVPAEFEIPAETIETILQDSVREAGIKKIRGKELTPFLLAEMSRRSGGETLSANLALLENNARIAAQIAVRLY
ncbi:MAG: pseudouridine-5'-phosphate glycosidase [Acidobacteriota bacterium]|nr:pseudouridine-5'-phosphate glycosidase [Acidobacteriota bacterium]